MELRNRARWGLVLAVFLVAACDAPEPEEDAGSDGGSIADSGPDAMPMPDGGGGGDCMGPPGLYADTNCSVVAAGVRAYRPLHFLWSDGAEKERFIYLPPGEQIDTSDPDNWVFPVGTRIYKTFSLDGVRLETRLLEKHGSGTGPAEWYMRAYVWNETQDRVTEHMGATPLQNVLGTEHDVPSQAQCIECHSGVLDTSNSFSAIQLNHDLGGLNLQTLLDEGLLSDPIALTDAVIPGDRATSDALGYLHANCGNCHRQTPGAPGDCLTPACRSGLRMWVDVGTSSPDMTNTWTTAVGVVGGFFHPDLPADSRCRIHPGDPDRSFVYFRMGRRGDSSQMPPIGTEIVHDEGREVIRSWIAGLTADPTPCLPAGP